MKLARSERAFAHLNWADLPDGAVVTVEFGDDGVQHATTGTGQTRSILVRGPDAANTGGAVLISASCAVTALVDDTPESLPRPAGIIILTD